MLNSMEPVQVLLFTVVSILTGLLLAVGIQVFIVLHEARKTISKINRILEKAEDISDAVSRPIRGITDFMDGVRNLKGLVDMLIDKHDKSSKMNNFEEKYKPANYPQIEIEDDKVARSHPRISLLQERGRRFFRKGGKTLFS